MNKSVMPTPFASGLTFLVWLVRVLGTRQTYLDSLYVLSSLPLGVIYALLIAGGVVLTVLLATLRLVVASVLWLTGRWLGRVLGAIVGLALLTTPIGWIILIGFVILKLRQLWRERYTSRPEPPSGLWTRIVVFFDVSPPLYEWLAQDTKARSQHNLALWQRLCLFERDLTARWLKIDLHALDRLPATPGAPLSRWAGAYLVIKPLVGWAAILVSLPFLRWLNQLELGPGPFLSLVKLLPAIIWLVPTLYGLYALAVVARYLARLCFIPNDMAQRLQAAEAVAAQEHLKAEQAEQRRRELIVNVSHELRTPIASIRGHIDSLLLALETPTNQDAALDTTRSYLTTVQHETERLSALVDELLLLARADSGELSLILTPVNVTEVIEDVYQSLMPLARRERCVTIVRDVEPELPLVWADRQRLAQVLLNLVRNAITYTPEGGIVSMTALPDGPDRVLVAVADTGIGIPPEELDLVFERFYRTDASRARTSGGFGLGLTIVRDLVTAMGGEVTAQSRPNEGSCFQVRLRIAQAGE